MAYLDLFTNGQRFLPDSNLHVFRCNANDAFYHGSSTLSRYEVLYPAGLAFSRTLSGITPVVLNGEIATQRARPDIHNKNSIITRLGNPDPGFFSTLQVSMLYSSQGVDQNLALAARNQQQIVEDKCAKKCIHTFELIQNSDFIVMNNVWNVIQILIYIRDTLRLLPEFTRILNEINQPWPPHQKLNWLFKNFYSIEQDIFLPDMTFNLVFVNAITRDDVTHIYSYDGSNLFGRVSVRDWDLPLAKIFCLYLKHHHDQQTFLNIKGIGNNPVYMGVRGHREFYRLIRRGNMAGFDPNGLDRNFHPEVIFCNQLKDLKRSFRNPLDWQFNQSRVDNTRYIGPYLDQLEKFKVINFNNYSGDLYETTIWTLLIYEELVMSTGRCRMKSAPVALLSYYLEPYSKCMEVGSSIIHRNPNGNLNGEYLLNILQVHWDDTIFNVISSNLFIELNSFLQDHSDETLIYMKIVTYIYLICKDQFIDFLIRTNNFNFDQRSMDYLLKKITYLLSMYNVPPTLDYINNVLFDVCYLVLATFIAKSSTFDFFQSRNINILSNQANEIVNARRKTMNIKSRIFPFLSNISCVHKGFPYNQANIQAVINDLGTRIFNFTQHNLGILQTSFTRSIVNNNKIITKLNNLRPRIGLDVYNNALRMEPYVKNILSSIMVLCPEIIIENVVMRNNKRENIIYVLKLLKPFFNILFEEFSSKRFTGMPNPVLTEQLPRRHHNGLNHLRSVYFTAFFLEKSTFIEQNNVDNNELFLILLSSYFVGLARFDENLTDPNPTRFTANDFYTIFEIPNNLQRDISNYFYPNEFGCSHFQYLSCLILSDVFKLIKRKIPGLQTVDDRDKFNIDNALHLSALTNENIYLAGENILNQGRVNDFVGIIRLGQYFDDSRPGIALAQLDTTFATGTQTNNPRGPRWLFDFINKYYNPASAWITKKQFFYSRIYQSLQESGYRNLYPIDRVNMDIQDGLRMGRSPVLAVAGVNAAPGVAAVQAVTGVAGDYRVFKPLYTNKFDFHTVTTFNFDAMSVEFNLAWKNIFASFFKLNYAWTPNIWITQNANMRNLIDAPCTSVIAT